MYFEDFKRICEEDGLNPTHLLPMIELELAKERAVEMYRAEKRLKELDSNLSDNAKKKIREWIKVQDGIRINHMFTALEYAEVSTGLGDSWNAFLVEKWKNMGMGIPKI